VTADLLKVVQTPTLAAPARKKAEQALAARRDDDSADLLVEALKQRADYVEDTQPTAVVAIARATMTTRSRPVAVALAEHLRRPETVPEAIIEISQAVQAAAPPMRCRRCATSCACIAATRSTTPIRRR